MMSPRESIVSALLEKLGTLADFKTVDREWTGTDGGLNLDSLPALYLIETNERYNVRGRGMPARIDWPFDLVLVVAKPQGTKGCAAINPLLDKLEELLEVPPGLRMLGVSVIGSLAYDVWVEGELVKNSSFLGGGACMAVAPLHLRTYNPS